MDILWDALPICNMTFLKIVSTIINFPGMFLSKNFCYE